MQKSEFGLICSPMLTDLDCKNATCPPDKLRLLLTDGAGLYLGVSPKGSKRWPILGLFISRDCPAVLVGR
jgi:hypothetical protein